jgi:hypothetical protein
MSGRCMIRISRIRLKSHVARMVNENCVCDFPRNIVTEYTTWGFIHRWEENIKMDVKET